jgi:hypothetical protein
MYRLAVKLKLFDQLTLRLAVGKVADDDLLF